MFVLLTAMKAFMLIVVVVPVAKAKIGMVLKALSAAFIGTRQFEKDILAGK